MVKITGTILKLFSIIIIINSFVIAQVDSISLKSDTLSFLAVGDINLGRKIGQRLLKGELDFPFEKVKDNFAKYNIVFGNLESQLSDQNGETQNPKHNLIFTGPPEGSISLKRNNITIVSTANNHAFDYGMRAFRETIENLKNDSVFFTGTSTKEDSCYNPVIIEKNNFKIAFFAVTDFLNIYKKEYKGLVAFPDTAKLFPKIRETRRNVDLVIISYHGGNEYVDYPLKKTVNFAHEVIDCGADLFIGHHPHVLQGIESYKDKLIFYSLGNFAFYQPQKYWTQKTFGAKFVFIKNSEKISLKSYSVLPAQAGLQPFFYELDSKEYDTTMARIKKLSPSIKFE